MKCSTGYLVLLGMLFLSIAASAQNVRKIYKGDFCDGKATYAYYVDAKTGDEVRDGAFNYTELISKNGSVYSVSIKGSYTEGFKDGIWNYTITHKDIPLEGGYYQTGSIVMVQSFKDGMPNGKWSYSENFKGRNRRYTRNGWYWSPFEVEKPLSAVLNYQNGIVSGEFRLNNEIVNASGCFNSSGFMTGKWQITKKDFVQIDLTAQNGIVTAYANKDVKTGKVAYRSKYDAELQQVQKDASKLSKEMLSKICADKNIKVDTLSTSNIFLFEEYFKQPMFRNSEIFGDKTYQDYNDTKNYGRYILMERKSENN